MASTYPNLTIVGLVGGVASGKSFVAEALERRGAVLLDADRAGHEALREPEVEAAARARWGDKIFAPDGHIHRPALAQIVFSSAPELAYLESLTHPRIAIRLKEQLEQLAEQKSPRVVVLDAPVMLKAGWDKFCNQIVFVDAPREVRLARALTRGWSASEFERREAAQEPIDVKRKMATKAVDNGGSPQATEAQIISLWSELTRNIAC
jgi:dephospho-CoA kinase